MSTEIRKLIQLESEHIETFSTSFRYVCSLVYDPSLLTEKVSVCTTAYIYLYMYIYICTYYKLYIESACLYTLYAIYTDTLYIIYYIRCTYKHTYAHNCVKNLTQESSKIREERYDTSMTQCFVHIQSGINNSLFYPK